MRDAHREENMIRKTLLVISLVLLVGTVGLWVWSYYDHVWSRMNHKTGSVALGVDWGMFSVQVAPWGYGPSESYLSLHRYKKQKQGSALVTSGAVTNIFAVGCPICNVLLVSLLGTTAILTYIEPFRSLLGVASTGLLGGAIVWKMRTRSNCGRCSIQRDNS